MRLQESPPSFPAFPLFPPGILELFSLEKPSGIAAKAASLWIRDASRDGDSKLQQEGKETLEKLPNPPWPL